MRVASDMFTDKDTDTHYTVYWFSIRADSMRSRCAYNMYVISWRRAALPLTLWYDDFTLLQHHPTFKILSLFIENILNSILHTRLWLNILSIRPKIITKKCIPSCKIFFSNLCAVFITKCFSILIKINQYQKQCMLVYYQCCD